MFLLDSDNCSDHYYQANNAIWIESLFHRLTRWVTPFFWGWRNTKGSKWQKCHLQKFSTLSFCVCRLIPQYMQMIWRKGSWCKSTAIFPQRRVWANGSFTKLHPGEVRSFVQRGLAQGNTNGPYRIQNTDLKMIIQQDNIFRRLQSSTCQTKHIRVNEHRACRCNPGVS